MENPILESLKRLRFVSRINFYIMGPLNIAAALVLNFDGHSIYFSFFNLIAAAYGIIAGYRGLQKADKIEASLKRPTKLIAWECHGTRLGIDDACPTCHRILPEDIKRNHAS